MLSKMNWLITGILILMVIGFEACEVVKVEGHKSRDENESSGMVNSIWDEPVNAPLQIKIKALLTTRFEDLNEFKKTVSLRYEWGEEWTLDGAKQRTLVHLNYRDGREEIQRTLTSGIGQGALLKLVNADPGQKIHFLLEYPLTMRSRKLLEKFHMLSRRRADVYGSKDVAFYDLAESMVRHINTPQLAFQTFRDSLEKGYISTFNHITAQAIITAFFSEELADLIGDLHERHSMPELTTGEFTEKQLNDTISGPMDNYVDIINNEIGQRLGRELKRKYALHELVFCTPELLATLLNEIQNYCMWALEIGMDPFQVRDAVVVKFAKKMNVHLTSI